MSALADLRALAEQALENPTLTTQGELHAFADARAVLALVEVAEAAQAYETAYSAVDAITFTDEDDNASMQAVLREPVAARKNALIALRAALAGITAEETSR